MQSTLNYESKANVVGSASARKAAVWCGAVPLVWGVGATSVMIAAKNEKLAIFAALALLASLFTVPLGVLFLIVHAVLGLPEPDGESRVQRFAIAVALVLSVWPVALVCIILSMSIGVLIPGPD